MEFVICQNGKLLFVIIILLLKFGKKEDGMVSWIVIGKVGVLDIIVFVSMEFDGFMNYQIKVKVVENILVDDIVLLIFMLVIMVKYCLGMGYEGLLCLKSD